MSVREPTSAFVRFMSHVQHIRCCDLSELDFTKFADTDTRIQLEASIMEARARLYEVLDCLNMMDLNDARSSR